ncbi:MAG: homoserine dehydrogenase [Pseudomonadota bacterium]
MNTIRLGIAGLGTVAQGVLDIIARNGDSIAQRSGVRLRPVRVASRTARPEVDLLGAQFSTDLADLHTDPEVDVVVELIGGETHAADLIVAAVAADKAVVTANKAVIAARGDELLHGDEASPALYFEAAVAGAIPIIEAIRSGLAANQFNHVIGIINGTSNYILTAMTEQGAAFDAALARAQELGYAEADPTFDVEGIDAAHKLTILLALAFDLPFDFSKLYVEGIRNIAPADISYATELGYAIKHLGIARRVAGDAGGVEARVHPTLVPQEQLLANVNDVMNAVLVQSDAAGDTLFSGPGAGGLATASAVVADILKVVTQTQGPREASAATLRVLPIEAVVCPHYLRIHTVDKPGVFAQVANALSSHGISIEAAIQKQPEEGQDSADIVIVTQQVPEAEIMAAVAELEQLPQVLDIARIRIEPMH